MKEFLREYYCVGYGRVSTDGQKEASLPTQEKDVLGFVKDYGGVCSGWYQEVLSGYKYNEIQTGSELHKAVSEVIRLKTKKVNAVLAVGFSTRFTRNTGIAAELIKYGISVLVVEDRKIYSGSELLEQAAKNAENRNTINKTCLKGALNAEKEAYKSGKPYKKQTPKTATEMKEISLIAAKNRKTKNAEKQYHLVKEIENRLADGYTFGEIARQFNKENANYTPVNYPYKRNRVGILTKKERENRGLGAYRNERAVSVAYIQDKISYHKAEDLRAMFKEAREYARTQANLKLFTQKDVKEIYNFHSEQGQKEKEIIKIRGGSVLRGRENSKQAKDILTDSTLTNNMRIRELNRIGFKTPTGKDFTRVVQVQRLIDKLTVMA